MFINRHELQNIHQRRLTSQNTAHIYQIKKRGTKIYMKKPRTTP